MSITKGLYIKKPWTDLILSGKKIWEIRGFNCKIRGPLYMIESKTSLIVGEISIIDSISLSLEDFKKHQVNHQVPDCSKLPYPKTYAWVLSDIKVYETPIKHIHTPGTVIFVNFK